LKDQQQENGRTMRLCSFIRKNKVKIQPGTTFISKLDQKYQEQEPKVVRKFALETEKSMHILCPTTTTNKWKPTNVEMPPRPFGKSFVIFLEIDILSLSTHFMYTYACHKARNGENRQLVTNELVEFERQPSEVQDFQKITDHFRGI